MAETSREEVEAQRELALTAVPEEKLAAPDSADPEQQSDFIRYVAPSLLVVCVVTLAAYAPWVAAVVLLCLVLLSPCVILHELGHLVTARRAGIGVSEFYIGFGPRLWSTRWRGITWSLRALPFGGAVELEGMTVEDVEQRGCDPAESFIYKTPMARLKVVLAGVTANVGLAWVTLMASVVGMQGGGGPWFYVTLPLRAILMIALLLRTGFSALAGAVFHWSTSDAGSILSLPDAFASGAVESMDMGIPLWVFIGLFFAVLNLSLALFNVLPLYPLDGYHAATAVADQARRIVAKARDRQFYPLPVWRLRWATRCTGAFLAVFVGSLLLKDVLRMM